jgi:hypothetical protein
MQSSGIMLCNRVPLASAQATQLLRTSPTTASPTLAPSISTNPESQIPLSVFSISAFPNPFNSTVAISFQLITAIQVDLRIYDIAGREVATLDTWG